MLFHRVRITGFRNLILLSSGFQWRKQCISVDISSMLKMDGSAVPNGARADTQKTQGPDGHKNVALVEGSISGYDFGERRYPPDSGL
jgi:hypothetical protein